MPDRIPPALQYSVGEEGVYGCLCVCMLVFVRVSVRACVCVCVYVCWWRVVPFLHFERGEFNLPIQIVTLIGN